MQRAPATPEAGGTGGGAAFARCGRAVAPGAGARAGRSLGRVRRRQRAPGIAALRGLSLTVDAGESVALLGRNGAGKSTLLHVAAGIRDSGSGLAVGRRGRSAWSCRVPPTTSCTRPFARSCPRAVADAALEEIGLRDSRDANPRDLSGGERQRLALAIVLAGRGIGGGSPPAVVALDEPTRGIDAGQKLALAARLRSLAAAGAAVIVATHDVEFAARLADRCVLLGEGRVVADGPTRQVLSGGRYFATEVARVLGPVSAVLPSDGARACSRLEWSRSALVARVRSAGAKARGGGFVSSGARSALGVLLALAVGFAWYERGRPPSKLVAMVAALAALAVAGRVVFAPIPNVQATTDVVLLSGCALGAAPGFAVGAVAAFASNFFLGQGPWTPWQMLGWGAVGVAGGLLAPALVRPWRAAAAAWIDRRLRRGGACLRRVDGPLHARDLLRGAHSVGATSRLRR